MSVEGDLKRLKKKYEELSENFVPSIQRHVDSVIKERLEAFHHLQLDPLRESLRALETRLKAIEDSLSLCVHNRHEAQKEIFDALQAELQHLQNLRQSFTSQGR